MNHSARSGPVILGLSVSFAVVLALGVLGGCQRRLFNEKDPRNQFETHDRLRQDFTPLEFPNEFGEMQPALRARLAPRT